MDAQITIRSSVAGRVRWDVPSLLNRPEVGAFVNEALAQEPGVLSASANPVTGRVLLVYDPQFSQSSFHRALQMALANASRVPAVRADDSQSPPLLRLLALTRKHKQQALLAFVVAFVDRLFEAAPPAMIGAAMDVVTNGTGAAFWARLGFRTVKSRLFALGGLCMVVWTIDALMGYWHRVTSARLAQSIQDDLRNQVYQHLQTLDVGQLERKSPSYWTGLFDSDIDQIGQFIETGIDPIITMATNSLIVTTAFLMNSPALFATQLLIVPGLYLVSSNMLGPIRRRHEIANDRADELSAALRGNVSGISTIAVFGTQELEAARIARLSGQAEASAVERAQLTAAYIPAIQMVVGVGFLTTLMWGGVLVERGTLSIASYNVMGFSSLRLLVAFGSLGSTLAQYQRTVISIERILNFMNMQPAIRSGQLSLPPAHAAEIAFENVSFEYEPGRPVLQDVSLRIASGRTTAIVGSTGAGKTTLLKLILRFYETDGGSIQVDGTNIRDLKIENLRDMISLVPQQIFLIPGTIRENIGYSREAVSMEDVVRAARAAQAHEFIETLPAGYATRVGDDGTVLSGGQEQRIAIARTILANRWILLFDEATSAIDYETEAAIQRALQEVMAGRTTVIVAHRLSTVRQADWIYVLSEGRVAEQGRHADLIQMKGIYAQLWRIQTGEKPGPRKRNPKA
jgi:ATP-binding cassette subfamily B protein